MTPDLKNKVEVTQTEVEANLVGGGCPADLDGNGVLNVDDVDAFAAAFAGFAEELVEGVVEGADIPGVRWG